MVTTWRCTTTRCCPYGCALLSIWCVIVVLIKLLLQWYWSWRWGWWWWSEEEDEDDEEKEENYDDRTFGWRWGKPEFFATGECVISPPYSAGHPVGQQHVWEIIMITFDLHDDQQVIIMIIMSIIWITYTVVSSGEEKHSDSKDEASEAS